MMTDTPSHIQKILIEGYQRMSPAKKMQKVAELNKSIQQLALARIRKQYGDLTEREEKLHLASLWPGRNLMIKIFSWDPEKEGY